MNDSQRERAARMIAQHLTGGHDQRVQKARAIIDEAMAPAVEWPTVESHAAFRQVETMTVFTLDNEDLADCLRAAFGADPIHQIAMRIAKDWRDSGVLSPQPRTLITDLDELLAFCTDAELL